MDHPEARPETASGAESATPLDPQRFAALFQASARVLWCIGVAVHGDRTLADDTLQEAAVIALGKLDEFNPATSFTAWMGQIIRFVALNQGRRTIRSPVASHDPSSLDLHAHPPENTLPLSLTARGELVEGQEEFDDSVARALRRLDADARCCLLLRTVMNMPYREISRALDMPEGTAMSHVHRARQLLRQELHEIHILSKSGGARHG